SAFTRECSPFTYKRRSIPNFLIGVAMDIEYLERLIALLEANNTLSELEIEENGNRVRLAKFTSNAPQVQTVYTAPAPAAVQTQPQAAPSAAPAPSEGHEVHSPIVGTFYRAASPDAPPFVEVGQHVEKGQTICIVEAMKLMNEIESDASGTIIKVLVENGKPVEYNQPLFVIRQD
ncbi:MAG TPA: acetyl-CoA carboxylase biotin carboxyl carrier protein, partial [Candidatus Kapabacteria bacterium]|nr:acetyl-CoA carboxylase biotin carboxyl carrier protein [Candidatus Kapabacteria bacterium]